MDLQLIFNCSVNFIGQIHKFKILVEPVIHLIIQMSEILMTVGLEPSRPLVHNTDV